MLATFTRGFALNQEQYIQMFTASQNATPFQSWEWVSSWIENYSPKNLSSVVIECSGEVVGFWAGSSGSISIQTLGTGVSDYLPPLSLPGSERAVLRAVVDCLRINQAKPIDLHQVPSEYVGEEHDGWIQATCPKTLLPPTFEEFLRSLSKSLRYDVKKGFKNSALSFEEIAPTDGDRFLDELFRLHKLRWNKKHLPGAFGKKSQAFHRRYFSQAPVEAKPILLRFQDTVIGAMYVLSHKGTSYYYQAGFDPAFKQLSPGSLMVAFSIKQAIARGDSTFDFCRGDEAYKKRWNTESHSTVRIVSGSHRQVFKKLHQLEMKARSVFES